MVKNKPIEDLTFYLIDAKRHFEHDVTEETLIALLKTFPQYGEVLHHNKFYLDDTLVYDEDENERHYLLREFSDTSLPDGYIKVFIPEEHMDEAIRLREIEEVTEDLPPPPTTVRLTREQIQLVGRTAVRFSFESLLQRHFLEQRERENL